MKINKANLEYFLNSDRFYEQLRKNLNYKRTQLEKNSVIKKAKYIENVNKMTRDSITKRNEKDLIDNIARNVRDKALRAKGMKTMSDYIKELDDPIPIPEKDEK